MKIYENFDLTFYNAYRLKASCARAFFPETEEDIINIYKNNSNRSIFVLGNGNNIILSKDWYDSSFIIFNNCFDRFRIFRNIIIAESGCTMLKISEAALLYNLSGLEIFYDIPSSVGGAVVMNAGANGEEIKNLLVKVRYLDLHDMIIRDIDQSQMEFDYRNSFFQKHSDKVVLKAWFILKSGMYGQIKEKMDTIKKNRWSKQPREYPNCGSVFKRPSGYYVGPLLDDLGLKGFSIGGAKISEKHSGFIINTGNATANDILKIIYTVKKLVKEKYSLDLEVEQRII